MKLLVLLFALTAVTGGQAVTIREAPRPEPKLRQLVEKISTIQTNAFFGVVGIFMKILQSEPIREQLKNITEKLQEQMRELPPEMRELNELVSDLSKAYQKKTSYDFHVWNRRHYKENEAVVDALAVYVDPVASKVFWCLEWLEHNVEPMVSKMFEPYERPLDQAIESLWSTLIENLEEVGESLQTSLDKGATQLRLGVETLNKHFKPYWVPFLKEYKKYDPALREWMGTPLYPPPKED